MSGAPYHITSDLGIRGTVLGLDYLISRWNVWACMVEYFV